MNSSENRQKVLIQIDAVDITFKRVPENSMKDLPTINKSLIIPPNLKNRTHQNSFKTTRRDLRLCPRAGSGITNGTMLFLNHLKTPYKSTKRKVKYYQPANQLSAESYKKAQEVDLSSEFYIFTLDLFEEFLFETNRELIALVPCITSLESSCNRLEVFFEIPSDNLVQYRENIKRYLICTRRFKKGPISPDCRSHGPELNPEVEGPVVRELS